MVDRHPQCLLEAIEDSESWLMVLSSSCSLGQIRMVGADLVQACTILLVPCIVCTEPRQALDCQGLQRGPHREVPRLELTGVRGQTLAPPD